MAYENTSVPVGNSQADIRKILVAYGCNDFQFGEGKIGEERFAAIGFSAHGRTVRMRVPLKAPSSADVNKKVQRARAKKYEDIVNEMMEQEARRIWRVLHWIVKSRMEAVAERVETFEQAWLSHLIVDGTNDTFYEALARDGRVDIGAPLMLEAGS